MWVLKGIALGGTVFFLGTLVFLYKMLRPEVGKVTGISAITSPTLYNPLWWLSMVVIMGLALWLFRSLQRI